MAHTRKKNLLIVQRTITPYRIELFDKLSPHFKAITIISSHGEKAGANKVASFSEKHKHNITIHLLRSIKLPYTGESRSWNFFIYPHCIFYLKNQDIILLEGTSNLINNFYIVPIAKILRKKIIWWDAGYSPKTRTNRRKIIDFFSSLLIKMTDKQIAYSTNAKKYMKSYMHAHDCHTVLNTISTTFFDNIIDEIYDNVKLHTLNKGKIKLLYVGAVEKRKKVKELIDIIKRLNTKENKFYLKIVGDGDYLNFCKKYVNKNKIKNIEFLGRIYDKSELKLLYFNSDLFVLPGDGGLSLAQSILFGLNAVCVEADGTEYDYIDDKKYILSSISELEDFLYNFTDGYNRASVIQSIDRLRDIHFINKMVEIIA